MMKAPALCRMMERVITPPDDRKARRPRNRTTRMQRFTRLTIALDDAADDDEKAAALAEYFAAAPPRDAAWALHLLLGRKLPRALPSPELRALAAEASGLPEWLIEVSLAAAGDLAEGVALLIPNGEIKGETTALHEVIEHQILQLKKASEAERRERTLAAWRALDACGRLVWNRMALGELRAAAPRGAVVRALAEVAGVEPAEMAHRLRGEWDPTAEAYTHILSGDHSQTSPGRPYPFHLASPLQADPEALGERAAWQAEWRWDGVRTQLLRRPAGVLLWSRAEELLTDCFPELAEAAGRLPEGTALDGMILAWRDEAPLPPDRLQARLGGKDPSKKTLQENPAIFMAFDLLELDSRDLRPEPLRQRRRMLEELSASLASEAPLRISPVLPAQTWQALADHCAQARANCARGLMLKRLDAPYRSGRLAGDWWKWHAAPHAIDAVLLYAQSANAVGGARHGLFTLGVWSEGLLVSVAKVASDLPEAELREIESFIRANTVEKHGPVRVVRQELVFELAFEGVQRSARHKAGLTLREPRVVRWKRGAMAGEAGEIDALRALIM